MKRAEDSCIGCIFGTGDLPNSIINQLEKSGKRFVVVYINPTRAKTDASNRISVSVGQVGKILSFLKEHRVTDVVLAGKVSRPASNDIKLPSQSFLTKLGLKFLNILKGGDDQIISRAIRLLEFQGYRVVSPESLVPELLTPAGVLTKRKPSKQDLEDISVGKKVLTDLGAFDVGQAIVVENGRVLGIEAAEGTDELIARCSKLKRHEQGGVLIKLAKSGQETRTDLPATGLRTLIRAHRAGLDGIALQARASLIIDIEKVVAKANELGLFIFGA